MAFDSVDDLRHAVGSRLGPGHWIEVDQVRIDRFAAAVGDRPWTRADAPTAGGPAGGGVAHGSLVLSLLPALVAGRVSVSGARMSVNYGLDRVRFPAPVPAGARVRASVDINDVAEVTGGVQVRYLVTVERAGGDEPVCLAEAVTRVYL